MRILVGIVLVSSMACAMEQQQYHIANKRQLRVPEGWTEQQYTAAIASGQQQARYMSEPEEQQKKQKQQMEVTTTTAQTDYVYDAYAFYDQLAKIGTNNDLQQEIHHYLKMPPKIAHRILNKIVQKNTVYLPLVKVNRHYNHMTVTPGRGGSGVFCGIGIRKLNNRQKIIGFSHVAMGSSIWDEEDESYNVLLPASSTSSSTVDGVPLDYVDDFRGNELVWGKTTMARPSNEIQEFEDANNIRYVCSTAPADDIIEDDGTRFSFVSHLFQGSPEGPYAAYYNKPGFMSIRLFDRQKNETAEFRVSPEEQERNIEFVHVDGKDYVITTGIGKILNDDGSVRFKKSLHVRDMYGKKIIPIIPQEGESFRHFMCYEDDKKDAKLILNTDIAQQTSRFALPSRGVILKLNISDVLRVAHKKFDPYQLSFLRLIYPYMVIKRKGYLGSYHLRLHLNENDHALALKTLKSFDKAIKNELMEYIAIEKSLEQQSWYGWAKSVATDYTDYME